MPPSPSDPDIDPRSGYCAATRTFHILRSPAPLPPPDLPLSFTAFAFKTKGRQYPYPLVPFQSPVLYHPLSLRSPPLPSRRPTRPLPSPPLPSRRAPSPTLPLSSTLPHDGSRAVVHGCRERGPSSRRWLIPDPASGRAQGGSAPPGGTEQQQQRMASRIRPPPLPPWLHRREGARLSSISVRRNPSPSPRIRLDPWRACHPAAGSDGGRPDPWWARPWRLDPVEGGRIHGGRAPRRLDPVEGG
ncbi:formin-like protein 14 [Miscanthus floridulus]|uniref:formin-like protein 14 n=1 Tax=Miscanthus floridulus TaxID=154761 RepID=UPI00345B22C5